MASGLPYTILRPSRLTDGPYTSYDLNTLLQVGMGCVGGNGGCCEPTQPLMCAVRTKWMHVMCSVCLAAGVCLGRLLHSTLQLRACFLVWSIEQIRLAVLDSGAPCHYLMRSTQFACTPVDWPHHVQGAAQLHNCPAQPHATAAAAAAAAIHRQHQAISRRLSWPLQTACWVRPHALL